MHSAPLFPLFLRLEGRRAVVVGAGAVGAHKARTLAEAGAHVTLIDPAPSAEAVALVDLDRVALRRHAFDPSDLDDAWLAIAATDDVAINAAVAEAAAARRVFCNAVDDPSNSSAYFASIVRRPPITVAISSNGEAPALSKLLREIVERILPDDDWIERARALRDRWRAEGTPMRDRFGELVRAFAISSRP
jgi:uroporphyrin-III C-methyltransferase/precorrin-2 dehydrogenase/sirohydrochlorin ferrochelatase